MATKKTKKQTTWPQVVKGTHLTVTTHEDGRTELVWDDAQLLKEVQQAISSSTFNDAQVNTVVTKKTKAKTTKKAA